ASSLARASKAVSAVRVRAHMSIKQDRGPRVNDVEGFDHILPLAIGIGSHTADIFEIDLPHAHGCGPLQMLMERLAPLGDAPMGFEDAMNRAAGWQGELKELHKRVPFARSSG